MKLFFVIAHKTFVTGRIDKRIRLVTARQPLAFLLERKERAVIGKENVARQFLQHREGLFKIGGNSRVAFLSHQLIIECGGASGEDDFVCFVPSLIFVVQVVFPFV